MHPDIFTTRRSQFSSTGQFNKQLVDRWVLRVRCPWLHSEWSTQHRQFSRTENDIVSEKFENVKKGNSSVNCVNRIREKLDRLQLSCRAVWTLLSHKNKCPSVSMGENWICTWVFGFQSFLSKTISFQLNNAAALCWCMFIVLYIIFFFSPFQWICKQWIVNSGTARE